MRRELEDAAREGSVRSGSPVSIGSGGGGAIGGGGGVGGGGSGQGSLNDLSEATMYDRRISGGPFYCNEALPTSVHMKFVGRRVEWSASGGAVYN